jgi:hypothetical protein
MMTSATDDLEIESAPIEQEPTEKPTHLARCTTCKGSITFTPPVSTTVQAGESLLDARRRLDREQEEYESIWDGRGGLTSYQGNSSLRSMS